ncbi:HNH endonuclease signature motif containing protein [Rhodococcoides fascians]|uniref:HNH endonuclease signature motif containing protein n=1 Tax=Rhodococcoides fascians TaxID=1828 RepID=UPI0009B8CFB0|nr:HNH endonuclease signature motif containing protein [Rhodococcus fascians]
MLMGDEGSGTAVDDSAVDSTGSVLPIEAAYLAQVVATLERQVEILSRMNMRGASTADQRAVLVRTEAVTRSLFGQSHTWLADLMDLRGLDDIWGSVPDALAVLLRISRRRAGQRIRLAETLGTRTAMTGERLAPELPATAAAAQEGVLDEEPQEVIRKFFRRLGSKSDVETRASAERQLAQLARELGPDEFAAAARRLYDLLDPDGDLTDESTLAERCYVKMGKPGPDGLRKGSFVVDPETGAYMEAIFEKWAKPGMLDPDDASPLTDPPEPTPQAGTADAASTEPTLFGGGSDSGGRGEDTGGSDDGGSGGGGNVEGSASSEDHPDLVERARRDRRSVGRRQHDALKAITRQMLASGKLGSHRGLPVTTVIVMQWKDLQAGTGHAVTAAGTTIRMRDAIRMASHAEQYLALFDDDGRPLHLARTKRLASADQRIVLIAADRGCSFPGCTRPATRSQTHHIEEWAQGGRTDIGDLTFGCDIHHPLVGPGDNEWATTKAGPDHPYPGRTLWHSPVSVDPQRRGRVNHFHHPGEYIVSSDTPLPGLENHTTGTTGTTRNGAIRPQDGQPTHPPTPSTPTPSTPTPRTPEASPPEQDPPPGR